jgi:hypothetical protein
VDERQRAPYPWVFEVRVELGELLALEASLVDKRARGEAHYVATPLDLPVEPATDHVQFPFEGQLISRPVLNEELPHARHVAPRQTPGCVRLHGHVSPAQETLPLLSRDPL